MKASLATDVLPGGQLTPRLARLFWSWPHIPDLYNPDEAIQAVATILQEGTPDDWAQLNIPALCRVIDEVPLFGNSATLWHHVCEREAALMRPADRVIGPDHHAILAVAAEVLAPDSFQLAGGTALAAGYLGHRKSDDLDFFRLGRQDITATFAAFVRALDAAGLSPTDVEQIAPSYIRATVRGIKVELATDANYVIQASTTAIDGMPIRSLPDLAADKTLALFDRATTRDFVDVYQLTRTHYDLDRLMDLAAQKDTGFDKNWFAKALQRAHTIHPGTVSLLVPVDFDQMRTLFFDTAARLLAERRLGHDKDEGLDR